MASLWQEREKQLLALRERAKRGGGEARMNKQRAAGKLTARERLTLLFDPDTFVEIGNWWNRASTISAWTSGACRATAWSSAMAG